MICPHCQTDNPDAAHFCLRCGQELLRKCSNCHSELPMGAHFCMQCGQPVQTETSIDSQRLSQLAAEAPGELVQKIRTELSLVAKRPAGALREQRVVTTLLADVVGSTGLSEKLGLEAWTELINTAFDCIAKVIYKYEGTIARILGDSLLAFFGAPLAHEDDPQRAISAGLEIIEQIRLNCHEHNATHAVDFKMRVCINTGPVIIGAVGGDLTYDYNASGATINLTSRIKFAGKPMSVLVTGNTYPFISPYFECHDLGSVSVKGVSKPMRVYQVISARSTLGRTRGFSELASPMVGRQQELETLMNTCDAVRAGLGRAVLITGEPGLGKTRLIQEWQKAVEAKNERGYRQTPARSWVTGRCLSYQQGQAYQLLVDLLRNMFGVTAGDDEGQTRATLEMQLQSLLGDRAGEIFPFLAHLLGLKLEGEAWQRTLVTDPQAMQMLYLKAMEQLLQAIMQHTSLILVLEDLHWADDSSIEVFTKLLPLVNSGPILFCLVTRMERESAGWKLVTAARQLLGGSLTEISLQSLSEKDSRSLVANLLSIETLENRVRAQILDKAEGNPLFLEEVIRMLIARGAISFKDGAWITEQEISPRDIPDNLQGLLLARIDRLPSEARYTLMVASVIGRNFLVKVLSQVLGGA
ncbi:MAG: zinc-ribbon domain-containing protein [Anaerolineae bacterium]|nr:zinc-ribbon domain-containing protein [Anaerolineae bacterium]